MTGADRPSADTVAAALAAIPADCDRDVWLRVGMAVHAEFPGNDGLGLFDAWSSTAASYSARNTRDVWRSFKPGRVTVGTLFHLAAAHGYKPAKPGPRPRPTAAEMKAATEARRAAAERERAETEERQRHAAAEALALWERGADVTDPAAAPYLARKATKPYGVRALPDGTLIVPALDAAGELVNAQTIKPAPPADGGPEKLFVKGARTSGTISRAPTGC